MLLNIIVRKIVLNVQFFMLSNCLAEILIDAPEADDTRLVLPLQTFLSRESQGGSLRTSWRINTGDLNTTGRYYRIYRDFIYPVDTLATFDYILIHSDLLFVSSLTTNLSFSFSVHVAAARLVWFNRRFQDKWRAPTTSWSDRTFGCQS